MWRRFLETIQSLVLLVSLSWAVQAQEPVTVQSAAAQAAEDRILAILQKPFTGRFDERPLNEALARIARSTGQPIQVDAKALEEASLALDSPVSCELSGVTLRSALDLILTRLDLTWVIHDECLLVTTPDKASNDLIAKIYPVQDFARVLNGPNPYAAHCGALIEMITSTIAPTTWDEVGGPGSITFFAPSGSLVISQTREVHEEIETLLPALRFARDMQRTAPAAHVANGRPRRTSHRHPQSELADPPRYVVAPTAAWSLPRVHE